MYQNFYPYDYHNNSYQFRVFERLVGEFFIPQNPGKLEVAGTVHDIPAGTRIFIHKVEHAQTGQEMVSIVIPLRINGVWTIEHIKIPADQLLGRGRV